MLFSSPATRFPYLLFACLLGLTSLNCDGSRVGAAESLFCVGTPDGYAAEFGLARDGSGYSFFSELFPTPVEYVIGKSKPTEWPYIHPSTRDSWAGGKPHSFTIRFDSPQAQREPLYLVLGLAGAHPNQSSQVTVSVSGRELPPQTAPAGSSNVLMGLRERGEPQTMTFAIPPGTIEKGPNRISIRLSDESWVLYDYVALRTVAAPPELQEGATPDLLTSFREGPMADVEEIVFAVRKRSNDGHWYANFGYYSYSEVNENQDDSNKENRKLMAYGRGGKLCRLNLRSGKLTTLIDDPQGGVRDPVVDYDAKKILFSYRPGSTENYHLYDINIDGSELRQLTDGPYDDFEPCYLPDGDIVFVSSRCKRWVQCWVTQVAVLHRCAADGSGIRAISGNLEQDNTPWVLPDGRILYQRWEYVDRSQVDYHHLWTTNPDGTSQMVYFGNMNPGVVMIDAKPIPGSKNVLAIFSPGHGANEHDGYMAIVNPSNGPDDKSQAQMISRTARFRDPWAFSETAFMAARGQELMLVDDFGATQSIYRLPQEEIQVGFECHEPRPLIARKRERLIPDRVDQQRDTGTVVLADVYQGRNMSGIKRGEIKKLLVMESLPKPINYTGGMDPLTYGGSFTLERVLGTVPVEEDGSAHLELPAMRSLFFIALDDQDMAVKRMQSFLTVQPGEVTGCVGCHEQRTETFIPPGNLAALSRRPSRIKPIDDCPDVFDFPRDIQPILDQLCVDCHGYEATDRGGPYAGGTMLTGDHGPMFSHAYFTMTVQRIFTDNRNEPKSNHPPRTLGSSASRIFDMIDGSHYGVKATQRQKTVLRLWIDAGAPYPGTYAALGCGSIGGYIQNALVNTDFDWPTTVSGARVIQQRCTSCHQGDQVLPLALSDEREVSFWRFNLDDPRLKLSRHIVFNLTRPEKSLLLLAPLAQQAGGFGSCRDADGQPVEVFRDTTDPGYQALLSMVQAGKNNLDKIKRFDMPGFQPTPQYMREMKRFGVASPDGTTDAGQDGYSLDRRYWQSFWHQEK